MKLSDISSKIRNFFQPVRESPSPEQQLGTLRHDSPHLDDKKGVRMVGPSGVEIFIPNTTWEEVEAELVDALPENDLQEQHQESNWYEIREEALRQWDGKSVRAIPLSQVWDLHPETAAEALPKTVPAELTGFVAEPKFDWTRTSPEHRHGIQILAIDPAGEALIATYAWNKNDEEGIDLKVVSVREAVAQIQQYRGAALDVATARSLGLDQATAENAQEIQVEAEAPDALSAKQVESALPGQSYRGPVSRIDGTTAYQDINARTSIAHDVRLLLGSDVTQLLGKAAEISYPHGQVGLVQVTEVLSRNIHSPGLAVTQRDMGESERSDIER